MNRSLEYAKRNIRRTPFQAIAASMVMFLTFFALLSFLIVGAGSDETLKFFERKPQAIAFFKEGTTTQDISSIENALKKYQEANKDQPLLTELVSSSILPASLEISTKSPEDLSLIADILSREPVVEQVFLPKDVIKNLTSITTIIRSVGAAVVGFLLIFATLVIVMIIGFKIRLKRSEIEIMRLLGASPSFIRNPFILEGIFYGVAGAVSAWIVSYGLLWYFTPFLKGYLGEVKLLPVNPLFMLSILGASVSLAFIVGGLGSISAVRRYLKI